MLKRLNLTVAVAALVLSFSSAGLADSNNNAGQFQFGPSGGSNAVLDFGMVVPVSGSISYNGGKKGGAANPLVGQSISISYVMAEDAPQHDFVKMDLVGGLLNFQTGNFFSSNADTWFFAGGGYLTITAQCIDFRGAHNDTTCQPGDLVPDLNGTAGLVMTGLWDDAQVAETNPKNKTLKLQAGLIEDTVWQPLLGFYGLQNAPNNGNLNGDINLTMLASGNPNKSFKSTRLLSGDLADVHVPYSPEPGSLLLFCTGLTGMAGILRRKLKG